MDNTPQIQTSNSAGADIKALESVIVPRRGSTVVDTGYIYHVGVPGTVGLIKSRSSLAFRHGIIAFEGVIDSDYCGKEIKVLLFNMTPYDFLILAGERIAQIIIVKQDTYLYYRVNNQQRVGGFGSTNNGG